MRKEFFKYLYELMEENPDIWALTGDLGYGGFDKIRDTYPERFINVGAAETALIDIGIGLALSGKIPVCYSITTFLLYRPFESWRTYVNHESIPIIGIGSGRNDDYKHDGFSHFAGDDWMLFNEENQAGILDMVQHRWPETIDEMKMNLKAAIDDRLAPTYLNLVR